MDKGEIQIGVEVIIINWNTRELLHNCLESLFCKAPAQLPDGFKLHVTVVDNASSDGSAEMVETEFSQVKVIRNKENVGFARANNQALAISQMSYFLLLNSDTLVLENSFKPLFDFMEQNPRVGVCGPRLLNADRTNQIYAWKFPEPTMDFLIFMEPFRYRNVYNKLKPDSMMLAKHTEKRRVDYLSGACLLLRREVYDAIGGLDEEYFFYSEEVDWCYRIWQKGWQIWFVPEAEIIHLEGKSSQRAPYNRIIWFHQGYLRFYHKFYSRRRLLGHRIVVWISSWLKILVLGGLIVFCGKQKRNHRWQLLKTYWKVLWLPAKL